MSAWLPVALFFVLTVLVALHVRNVLEVYLGASERRPRNVSGERRSMPPPIAEIIGNLASLGFRRLGEVELIIPDTGLLGAILHRLRRHTVWISVDSAATTAVEVVPLGPTVSFETWLADDSVVHTTFPAGENIDEPGLRSTTVRSSLPDAYHHHRLQVDARAEQHGQPRGVHSMGDYLRNDAEYRRRFARRYLRRALLTHQLLPAGLVLVFLLVTFFAALSRALGA
jgi:hypothetical protein